MKLKITADDICRGVRNDPERCPLARAWTRVPHTCRLEYASPELADVFVERFDCFGTAGVDPCELELVEK